MNYLAELKEKYKSQMDWPVKKCEPLNTYTAGPNLFRLKQVFDMCDLKFWLVFGTALGAYRDNGFIPHDYDTDVAIFHKDIPLLFKATELLRCRGFTLSRITGQLLSYAREKEYIDVYVFSNRQGIYKCGSYHARFDQFDNLDQIEFLGQKFLIPSNTEQYLKERYGEDWQKPIRNRPTKF